MIVHRSQLQSLEAFAGPLLHELTHAYGSWRRCRDFEGALTSLIGTLAARHRRCRQMPEDHLWSPTTERREMVAQIFTSWNPLAHWFGLLEALKNAA